MDTTFVDAMRLRLVGHKFATERQTIQIAKVCAGTLPGTEFVTFRLFGQGKRYRVSLLFVLHAIADGAWVQVA